MKRKKLDFELGEFVVRITPKLVDIETKDKQWKTQFGHRTREYAQVLYLIQQEEFEPLKTVATLLFYSKLVLSDKNYLNLYHKMLKKYFKDSEKKQKEQLSKEEDDKILKEEEDMYENTRNK